MTKVDIIALIRDQESDRVERTTTTKDTDKFCKAICAFANDLPNHGLPGYLAIGLNDDGSCSGLTATDELLCYLADLRQNGLILPQPSMRIDTIKIDDHDVVIVEVQPHPLPPVRYKGQIWVRIGPTKSIASQQDEHILSEKRLSKIKHFDALPCFEATLNDLALNLFSVYRSKAVAPDVIEANHRTIEEQLAALRCFDLKTHLPTHAGIILFGNNPRYFLSGDYVQYLKFPGVSLSDTPIDQAEITGDLSLIMRELDLRIKTNIQTRLTSVSLLQEQMCPDYPFDALRELLNNAIMHRDYASNTPVRFYCYEDRIEIHNPGGLFGEVSQKNFEKGVVTSYRNPVIAEALKTLGYVNRFGYGIHRAKALLEQNHNPPLEFDIGESYFTVKIFKRI